MTTLDFEPLTVVVPLREEPAGVLRVGKSRVLLELVLNKFKAGATPESIVQSYDTLNLADVYAIFSRYLSAPEPFEEYLTRSPLTVGEFNAFLKKLPELGDDADDFANDVREIRAEFPAEASAWD